MNSPIVLPAAASGQWFDFVSTAATVGPALGVLAVGVTADGWSRLGLVIAGVFGLLSAVAPAAQSPAVGAVIAGGWLTLTGRATAGLLAAAGADAERDVSAPSDGAAVSVVVGAVLLGGVTLSLFGAAGVRPALFRPTGTVLVLVGMAATPLGIRPGTVPLVVGGVAAVGTFWVSAAAPFTTGAVALIAGSVVGAPVALLAVALGGLTATITYGVLETAPDTAVVGVLLLAAGVPSSIPRALGAVLAVAFLAAIGPAVTAGRPPTSDDASTDESTATDGGST
ncbi:phosphate ABC transporter permease [Halosimplex aquaticum]